jgi:hypothetical protein
MMTVTALAGVAMLGLGGCSKLTEPYKDAPINERNTQPAQVGTMPDGFSNFATKCDHGNRVYVIFKGDNPNGSIAVVQNAKDC